LTDLLLAGEIDAVFAPIPPKKYHPVEGPIARLVPDFRPVERRYFEETRCYPPQHVIVLRKEAWGRDPSVGPRLVAAFNECEARFQESQHLFPYASPWLMASKSRDGSRHGKGPLSSTGSRKPRSSRRLLPIGVRGPVDE
jgi:4,5-dihydroxyphthalate decarboxylase